MAASSGLGITNRFFGKSRTQLAAFRATRVHFAACFQSGALHSETQRLAVEIASNATTFSIGMGLVDLAEKLINERGSAAVMEKRLLLIKEEAAVLERKNGEMACEVERLSKENAELKRMLAAATKAEEFVEEFGAAFKRKPDGTFHEAVYCPIHHTPASSMEGGVPYFCSDPNCGWSSNITPNTLKSTILKLNPNSLTRILGL